MHRNTGNPGTGAGYNSPPAFRISFCILTLLAVLMAVPVSAAATANGTVCNQGATIFIGEGGLNVTHALNQAYYVSITGTGGSPVANNSAPPLTVIGWWPTPVDLYVTSPSKTIDLGVAGRYRNMTVSPSDFVGYTGNWYLLNTYGSRPAGPTADTSRVFDVEDPSLDLRVWDYTRNADVTGNSVPQGEKLGFRIDTNMYPAVDGRYRGNSIDGSGGVPTAPADGYIDIAVRSGSGTMYNDLYNQSLADTALVPGPFTLRKNVVSVQPFFWGTGTAVPVHLNAEGMPDNGNVWNTGARNITGFAIYPAGTYTVTAESTLNHMKENYRIGGADYTGKTVSVPRTVTVAAVEPGAGFSADHTTGLVPLAVRFTDLSTGSPTAWAWNFGDGGTSTLRNASHTYLHAGTYTVSLTVTNAAGSDTKTMTGYIRALAPHKPVAAFTANVTSGKRPLAVQFTDQSSGSPASWRWSFGDGTASALQNPVHTYARPGTYTVSLAVKNAAGSDTATRINYIRVSFR